MAGGKTSEKPSSQPRADFEEIEAAVMETARGRWFLAEYARRHRSADTTAVLEALARLEARLATMAEHQRAEPVAVSPAPAQVRAATPAPEREPVAAPPAPVQGRAPAPERLPPPPPAIEPAPEPKHAPAPLPAEPAPQISSARADDLKAMAEELLRGSRLFDWVDTTAFETREDTPREVEETAPAPLPIVAEETNLSAGSGNEDETALEDEDLVEWEAELAERALIPPPPVMPAPAWSPPPPMPRAAPAIARPAPPPVARTAPMPPPPAPVVPASTALPDLPEIAPKRIERPLSERLTDLRQPFSAVPQQPAVSKEPKPIPSGPRVEDPTLTMTRDEKLALFS